MTRTTTAPLLTATAGLRAAFAGHPRRNAVWCCDALSLLKALPSGSVDLVVTSPPYNMGTQLNGATPCSKSDLNWGKSKLLSSGYETFDDAMPYPEYVAWQRQILTECMRVLSSTGAMFYNHKWRIQGGLLEDRKGITEGFPVRQVIIWNRGTSNNHNRSFFAPQYEVIYLIAKPDFRIRQEATAYGDVWDIPPERNNPHPAPFPLQLAERCIRSTDARLICDPFAGSGTTLLAAANLERDYIGCDISMAYVTDARKRLMLRTVPMFVA